MKIIKQINKVIILLVVILNLTVGNVYAANIIEPSNNQTYKSIENIELKVDSSSISNTLTTIKKGDQIKHLGTTDNSWFKVDFAGKTGFVHRTKVTSFANYDKTYSNNRKQYKTISDLDLKSNNSSNSTSIATLKKGSVVTYLEMKNDWFKVEIDNKVGYIHRNNVTTFANYDKTYNSNNNKITIKNIKELRTKALQEMNSRSSLLEVDYVGTDLQTREQIIRFIHNMTESGSYHSGNLGPFTVYTPQKIDNVTKLKVELTYRTTDEEEKFIDVQIKNIIGKIIKPNMNEYAKVKTIHDYIVNTTTYSSNTKTSQFSPYTLFKENKGVCNAYALSFSRFMNELGIENYYVKGQATGSSNVPGLHAWNKVKVNNVWYNIDATWNFPVNKWGLHNGYKYFLNSDQRFYKNHTPDDKSVLPTSTNKQYDGVYDNNFNKK